MTDLFDADFLDAVRLAGRAFRGVELRRAMENGTTTALINWLSAPGRPAEMRVLADLLRADYCRPNGRPHLTATQLHNYWIAINEANQLAEKLCANGEGLPMSMAKDHAAKLMAQDARFLGKAAFTVNDPKKGTIAGEPSTIRRDMDRDIPPHFLQPIR